MPKLRQRFSNRVVVLMVTEQRLEDKYLSWSEKFRVSEPNFSKSALKQFPVF